MAEVITRLMHLLEFSDSVFPVGGFSFSDGLETAAFEGLVHDADTLEQYVLAVLQQTIYCDGIAALLSFRAAAAQDYRTLLEADRQVILCRMSVEARQMLVRMGKKMAEVCGRIMGQGMVSRFLSDVQEQKTPGTYPVAQAVCFQADGLSEKDLFAAVEYGTANMVLNAALRCVRVSHFETQEILYRIGGRAGADYAAVRELGFEDMRTFAPEMDIVVSLHEKGKMRMFMN